MLKRLKGVRKYLNSTDFYLRYHSWAAWFWFAMIIPSVIWFRQNILWVILISLYANLSTEWGAWQSTRAEVQALRAELAAALAATRAEEIRDAKMLGVMERIEERQDDTG
jgi:hypothetical protein